MEKSLVGISIFLFPRYSWSISYAHYDCRWCCCCCCWHCSYFVLLTNDLTHAGTLFLFLTLNIIICYFALCVSSVWLGIVYLMNGHLSRSSSCRRFRWWFFLLRLSSLNFRFISYFISFSLVRFTWTFQLSNHANY